MIVLASEMMYSGNKSVNEIKYPKHTLLSIYNRGAYEIFNRVIIYDFPWNGKLLPVV